MPFLPNPYVLLGAIAGALALAGVSFYEGHHYATLQAQAALVGAQNAVIATKDKQAQVTATVEAAADTKQVEVRTVTQTIIKRIPIYVSPKADAGCAVPVGAVRLFAAAARGVPDLPDPAGRPDDAPAGVELSAVAAAAAEDLGTCQGIRARLISLQDWIAAQAAIGHE